MTRSYSMQAVSHAASRAVHLAGLYLRRIDENARIHDVQLDPRFQQRGVDLLWEREALPLEGIEVKGDRQPKRGNYFFELVSNLEKNTPGCFLYSEADVLLYVFLQPREVHHLPMPATREWFLKKASPIWRNSASERPLVPRVSICKHCVPAWDRGANPRRKTSSLCA